VGASETGVSAIVVARDEEDRIESCLRSIRWAGERIVVVDAATRDATAERARPLATELLVRPWEGFARSKQFAVDRARHPWVFWVDADEEVTPELAASIQRAVREAAAHAAFRLRRRNHYLGRVIRHGNWGKDTVVRLFRKDRGRFDDRLIHEGIVIDGSIGLLDGYLEHRSYRDLSHHWEKISAWSSLWADQALREGRQARWIDLWARPPARFVKGYLIRGGFLDGREGLILALMDAIYVGIKYARLLESRPARGERTPREELP